MQRRKKAAKRSGISRHFKQILAEYETIPITPDWKYWCIHALHWNALFLSVICILIIGYTMH